MKMKFSQFLLASSIFSPLLAHPGERHDPHVLKREIYTRDAVANVGKRALDACSTSIDARHLHTKNVERRAKTAHDLRKKRRITESM